MFIFHPVVGSRERYDQEDSDVDGHTFNPASGGVLDQATKQDKESSNSQSKKNPVVKGFLDAFPQRRELRKWLNIRSETILNRYITKLIITIKFFF